jgi:hypothetical protein
MNKTTKLHILNNWKGYFSRRSEGVGTTYERFILHRYFRKIDDAFNVNSVLEAPSFGMTGVSGINSMWWAKQGVQVTVLDDERERVRLINDVWREVSLKPEVLLVKEDYAILDFPDKSFDLGWNFASLWFVKRPEAFLRELTRVSRKAVFICVPNRASIFNRFRLNSDNNNGHLFMENINPRKIKALMSVMKWDLREEGFLDCPPWPDIAMNKEELLKNIGMKAMASRMESDKDNYLCILDYFSGKKPEMEKEILKHAYLEDIPEILKRFWAHHRYFIFTPQGGKK